MHEPTSTITSRPHTPESSWTSSLQDASATIDDLTIALASFSRVPSPQLSSSLICCCGQEDCENHHAWLEFKSKLESRLILSAEVGQALLQRHEAYVRQRERRSTGEDEDKHQLGNEVRELRAHNATLQKRLTQALVNSEVVENSNKVVFQELHEARSNIARLSAQQVRTAGLESRLVTITQEKEDIQQERDNADQRAKLAESRIVALRDRCTEMQDQLNALHGDLQDQRLELSKEILQDARARLKGLHHPSHDQQPLHEDDEVIKMVESLVLSNESLKRDNGEMQRLLSDSREDSRALQDELQELRARENHRYTRHRFGGSLSTRSPSLSSRLTSPVGLSPLKTRAASLERGLLRGFEPLTPETTNRPLSPDAPSVGSGNIDEPATASRFYIELDERSQRENQPKSPERTRSSQRPLLLLTRSRAVQTEPWKEFLAPSPRPTVLESSPSSHDGKSEVSSLTDAQLSPMSALLERATSLLNRLISSDAMTLTNRLKRQHLTGADVGHLSRTTVRTIVSEATMLRTNFRTLLEDENVTATLARKDLRALFKLLRDAFTEMGDLRMTLNDVILDPSVASKVSNAILNPNKSGESGTSSAAGWIAPIAKLFGGTADDGATNRVLPVQSTSRGRQAVQPFPPQRLIPKLEPALSASAMTVNVEFHTTAVGKAVTSTHSAHPSRENEGIGSSHFVLADNSGPARQLRPSSSIMGIFAGAPAPADNRDPWIVVPKPQRKPLSPLAVFDEAESSVIENGLATIGRSSMRGVPDPDKLSRTVDAIIDVESSANTTAAPGFQTTLLQRTLRPRGLSDSSIRTTFIQHGDNRGEEKKPVQTDRRRPEESLGSSVLAALSKKVLSFRSVSTSLVGKSISRSSTPKLPSKSAPNTDARDDGESDGDIDDLRSSSPSAPSRFFPGLSTWPAVFEPGLDPHTMYVGSPRQDWLSAREAHGRDI